MTEGSTRERLLDSAERLYAEQGIDATSLRAITAEAGANLAAVNYHFRSKRALTEAVFSRRILPINAERLRRLDELEGQAGERPASLEATVEAFVLPALQASRDPRQGGEHFLRLMGRIYTEPGEEFSRMLVQQFEVIFKRFTAALACALPQLSREELFWRFHFMVGATIHTIADPSKLSRLSGGLCDPDDIQAVSDRLVAFICGGLSSPCRAGREESS